MIKKRVAFFAGFSAFIAVFENFIPIPVPFFRLGLSNIPICIGFTLFKFRYILFITLFKVFFAHLFRGTLFSYPFLVGFAGNMLFIFFTFPIYKLLQKHISFVSISVLGAFFHNIGQILVASIFIPSKALIYLGAILIILGMISGFINGIISNNIYNKFVLRIFYGKRKTLQES